MELPEVKVVWSIKSLIARPPEIFEEAARLLGVTIYKLPTFTLALVEVQLTAQKLSSLNEKFNGMRLDFLDRF